MTVNFDFRYIFHSECCDDDDHTNNINCDCPANRYKWPDPSGPCKDLGGKCAVDDACRNGTLFSDNGGQGGTWEWQCHEDCSGVSCMSGSCNGTIDCRKAWR